MRATLPISVSAFLLAVTGVLWAAPGQSASATMTVSVEVVRSCTVQTDGGGSVDCHGQTPSTMRVSTSPAPAPTTTTPSQSTTSTPQAQILTIEF